MSFEAFFMWEIECLVSQHLGVCFFHKEKGVTSGVLERKMEF